MTTRITYLLDPTVRLRSLILTAALAAAGCTVDVDIGQHGRDGGPVVDAGGPEVCGDVVCGPGTTCCNASCGICTPPGVACTTVVCEEPCTTNADCADGYCVKPDGMCGGEGECGLIPPGRPCQPEDPQVCGCDGATYDCRSAATAAAVNVDREGACDHLCDPMDARGVGPCDAFFGYAHDGTRCGGLSGCSCEGADCGATYPSLEACEEAYADCARGCEPDDARGVGPCDAIVGIAWDGAACVDLSGCSCEGSDCGIYESEADCVSEHAICVDPCAPDDARAVGECDAIVGIAWNGLACVGLSGCECVGADCGRYASQEECEREHATCTGGCLTNDDCSDGYCAKPDGMCDAVGTCMLFPAGVPCELVGGDEVCGCDGRTYECAIGAVNNGENVAYPGACETGCRAMEATGVGPCDAVLGWVWEGARCAEISGCECEGPDCASLFVSGAACEAEYGTCDQPIRQTCGGFAGVQCRRDEFCDYDDALCGGADGTGLCRPRPEVCTDEVDPVLGCDGLVYTNLCEANRAGTDGNPR
jgi:hypothetical protein